MGDVHLRKMVMRFFHEPSIAQCDTVLCASVNNTTGRCEFNETGTAAPSRMQRPLVFTSKTNTPMGPKNLANRVLRPTCVKLGLRPISWHVLRHTHATWLSESGATIRAAQDILGQSDVETTLRVYTHSVPESKRRAIANVAALLFPSVPPQESQEEQRQEPVN